LNILNAFIVIERAGNLDGLGGKTNVAPSSGVLRWLAGGIAGSAHRCSCAVVIAIGERTIVCVESTRAGKPFGSVHAESTERSIASRTLQLECANTVIQVGAIVDKVSTRISQIVACSDKQLA
jgi:hypothetical protein